MSDKLFNIARSKLHVQSGARDSVSLCRWVLLKNSITSQTTPTSPDDADERDELDTDSFIYPDAGKLGSGPTTYGSTSEEAQWFDSVLEMLGDDDEDDFTAVSNVEDEDDNDDMLSLVGSPVSSSDDLLTHPTCFAVPYSYPYPVPYPPFHPPLIYPYELDPASSYDEPLPYYDIDIENSSVPDAIEDTSDDESSDAPTTPSLGRSSNSLAFLDAVSSTPERSSLGHPHPHVHVEPDDPYFYPFEFDPLPFPHDQPYNNYQEC